MKNYNSGVLRLGMTNPVPDGLSLEYKRNYGTARRNLYLADLVNHPAVAGELSILSYGLPKEFFDLSAVEVRTFPQDLSDAIVTGGFRGGIGLRF